MRIMIIIKGVNLESVMLAEVAASEEEGSRHRPSDSRGGGHQRVTELNNGLQRCSSPAQPLPLGRQGCLDLRSAAPHLEVLPIPILQQYRQAVG